MHFHNILQGQNLSIVENQLFRIKQELREVQELLFYKKLGFKAAGFDFVGQIATGKTLLIGEGNLSFTLSLTQQSRIDPAMFTATTLEKSTELSPEARQNAEKLRSLKVVVLNGVDATDLVASLGTSQFYNIIFQFPHTGSRNAVRGSTANFFLIKAFLKSAAGQMNPKGQVLISAVNNPHYRGTFQFEEAAKAAGYQPPKSYPFYPSAFPGYTHTMTNEEGEALSNHDTFATWVFKLR